MGTTLTTTHRLIKADDNEPIDVDHLNDNWDKLDSVVPNTTYGGIPEGKTPKVFKGRIVLTTGAGGENREEKMATGGDGIGGLWLGYNGVPKFEGISYISLKDGGNLPDFLANWEVLGHNTTRIKFEGHKVRGGVAANGYATVNLFVEIVGW